MSKLRQLDSKITKLEGGKSQAKVHDERQIRALICIEMARDSELVAEMIKAGKRLIKARKLG